MKQLFFCLSIFMLFTSCQKNETHPKVLATNKEITEKIDQLYTFDKSGRSCYECTVPKNLFSADLEKILDEVNRVSNADEERIKKSKYPTDKPMMLEGSTFTGMYEGISKYEIEKITVTDTIAKAIVKLEYNQSSPVVKWKDTISFVNENGWKIDNIIFPQQVVLKNQLKGFISETKKQLPN